MFTVVIDDTDVRLALAELRQKAQDVRPAWAAAAEVVIGRAHQNFRDQQAGPEGEAWKPLAWSTLYGRYMGRNKRRAVQVTRRVRDEGGWTYENRTIVVGKKAFRDDGSTTKAFGSYLSGHKILVRTGRLLRSITGRAYADHAEVGTNLVYAAIHNFGGPCGKGHAVDMPQREFLTVDEVDVAEIEQVMLDHLQGQR